jgi:hypothetical protein
MVSSFRPKHPPKAPPITRVQRQLWADLNDEIREWGAWVVSQPDVFPLRFECEMDSPPPATLQDLGHSVHHLGSHQRLMVKNEQLKDHSDRTVSRQRVAPGLAAVYDLSLIMKAEKAKA